MKNLMKANWSWSVAVVNGHEGLITKRSYTNPRPYTCGTMYGIIGEWTQTHEGPLFPYAFDPIAHIWIVNDCFGLLATRFCTG